MTLHRISKSPVGCQRERGVVLAVALIMLLVITLISVTSSNLAQTNLKVVQNLESREMARFAAKAAIEEAISSPQFVTSPGNVFKESCGVANTQCFDFNGDLTNDVTVVVDPPACVIVEQIRNEDLDVFNNPNDAECFFPPGEYSFCARSVWQLSAVATDNVTGAQMTVRQGVSLLTTRAQLLTSCPAIALE
ncbi:pilus assembly PilX family protein [Congregibacter sp.]|uniref:pilus assembly PilX family protein n=1 Tax=Congregibacter sp. TaxID=2744308 RepID=UPI003F6B55F6